MMLDRPERSWGCESLCLGLHEGERARGTLPEGKKALDHHIDYSTHLSGRLDLDRRTRRRARRYRLGREEGVAEL